MQTNGYPYGMYSDKLKQVKMLTEGFISQSGIRYKTNITREEKLINYTIIYACLHQLLFVEKIAETNINLYWKELKWP